ncbi:MAG: hypothetical protein U0694_18905 [Anaerolineae bacterium]
MYDAAGVPLSIEMMVNVVTTGSQGFATAINATGTHAIIAWTYDGVQASAPMFMPTATALMCLRRYQR